MKAFLRTISLAIRAVVDIVAIIFLMTFGLLVVLFWTIVSLLVGAGTFVIGFAAISFAYLFGNRHKSA